MGAGFSLINFAIGAGSGLADRTAGAGLKKHLFRRGERAAARPMLGQPAEVVPARVGGIPAAAAELVAHAIKILVVHLADGGHREVVGGPVSAHRRPDIADVLCRPDELL